MASWTYSASCGLSISLVGVEALRTPDLISFVVSLKRTVGAIWTRISADGRSSSAVATGWTVNAVSKQRFASKCVVSSFRTWILRSVLSASRAVVAFRTSDLSAGQCELTIRTSSTSSAV